MSPLQTLKDLYPLDSEMGKILLIRVVSSLGYDAALTKEAITKLAQAHLEEEERQIMAILGKNQ